MLDCLDLDTGHFRSTFLYCKHHDQIVQDDCLDRNESIQNDVAYFRKKYLEWQMKKSRQHQCNVRGYAVQRARRLSNLKEDIRRVHNEEPPSPMMPTRPESPLALRTVAQTPTPTKRRLSKLIDREHSSLNKIDRSTSKENNSSNGIDGSRTVSGYYKTMKPGLSPKKVLLAFNKLSLGPLHDPKQIAQASLKRRCRVRGSFRRASDSTEMVVEGQHIHSRGKSETKLTSDRTFTSNLFL